MVGVRKSGEPRSVFGRATSMEVSAGRKRVLRLLLRVFQVQATPEIGAAS